MAESAMRPEQAVGEAPGPATPPSQRAVAYQGATGSVMGLRVSNVKRLRDMTDASEGSTYLGPCFYCDLELVQPRHHPPQAREVEVLEFDVQPEEALGVRPRERDLATGPITMFASGNIAFGSQSLRAAEDPFPFRAVESALRDRLSRTAITMEIVGQERPMVRSIQQALEDLVRWTGLSHEALGYLICASRRSVYNWLQGRPISAPFEARIWRVRSVLEPLAKLRSPGELAQWLEQGDESTAPLFREQRWREILARAREEMRPRVLERAAREDEPEELEEYGADVQRAVLAMLTSAPSIEQRRRPDWKPRELTGVSTADDEE